MLINVRRVPVELLLLANETLMRLKSRRNLIATLMSEQRPRYAIAEIHGASCRLAALWRAVASERLEEWNEAQPDSVYARITGPLWRAAAAAKLQTDRDEELWFDPVELTALARSFRDQPNQSTAEA
ncbi:hypothetical protein [Bradyrhizobium septentrionale]|uniref:Uncharacterized protein n=2 Tax=Bradyrhizobium septentrionale TaxID=1404411 RepID=A0ABZ2P507_9BRAD|nr:hypothetical protein [Bradyrhizobium septentrionale]UGY19624.1 hypothetical protein HAP48_0020515 [Bradyrhizobium septentrionale]